MRQNRTGKIIISVNIKFKMKVVSSNIINEIISTLHALVALIYNKTCKFLF